jgi:hypothetical protein
MAELKRMHNYPLGSEVQRTDGHIYIKSGEGGWMRKQRQIAALKIEKRELGRNDRVFLKDGNPENLDLDNIVCIHFSGQSYRLKHSRVRYIPNLQKPAPTLSVYKPKLKAAS